MNREPLSRQRIIDTAMRLVDAEGLPAFTMRRLAEELGVEGASLYKHIPSKASVLIGMLQTMSSEVAPVYPASPTWRDRLRVGMSTFRAEGLRHPQVFVLALRPWEGINSQRREDDMRAMLEAGFTPEEAAFAFRALLSYVTGFVARETSYITRDPEEVREVHEQAIHSTATFPHSVAASQLLAQPRLDEAFEFGLNALLDGIESQVRSTGSRD
jgi:AcrR family transcriptional regulator